MNLGDLRDNTLSNIVNFDPLSKLPPQVVDQFIEYAARDVARAYILQNEALFRKTVVLNDGDPLPTDWYGFAYRAYYTLNGNRIPFFWTKIQKVARLLTSKYNLATATRPGLHLCNQILNTLPAGIQAVTLSYYQRPPALFGQADSTDDGLPPNASPYVWRGAAVRAAAFFMDPNNAWKNDEKLRQENLDSVKRYYAGVFEKNTKDVRNDT